MSNNERKLLQQGEELQKLKERRDDLLHTLRQLDNDIAYKQEKYEKLWLGLENQKVHWREWKNEADKEALDEALCHDVENLPVNSQSQVSNSEWQSTSTSRQTSGNVNVTNEGWGHTRGQAGPSSDIIDDMDSIFVSNLIRNDPDHRDLPKKKMIDMRFNHNVRAVSTGQRTERTAKNSGQFPSTLANATRVTSNQRARHYSSQPRSSVTYENIRPDIIYRQPNRNEEALLVLPILRETDENTKDDDKKKKKNVLDGFPSMPQRFNKKK